MALKKLRAINEIHRTLEPGTAGDKSKNLAPVRPQTEILKPGTYFMAMSQDQQDELLASGAAVLSASASRDSLDEEDEGDVVETKTKPKAPAKPKTPAKPAEDASGGGTTKLATDGSELV